MLFKKIGMTLCLMLLLHASFASSCNCIAHQLYEVWLNQNANVLDLNSVQATLGTGDTRKIIQQTYTWDNFNLIVRDGLTVQASGEFPPELCGIPLPSLAVAISLLGKPAMTTMQKLTWYSWYCCDSFSSIHYLVDAKRNLIAYKGSYCWSNDLANCARFTGDA